MRLNNSERLRYQLMTEQDARLLYELDQDPQVMRYINHGKVTSMEVIERIAIPRMQKYTNEKQGWGLWKVTIKSTSMYIGWVLVRPMGFFSESPEFDNIELGWRFKQSSWGVGYATEAALQIKQALVEFGGTTKITATALENNTGSISIMKKIGLQYIKTYIHKDSAGEHNAVYYQILL